MRKGHDIIGMRVIGREEGAELGHVLDLVFDPDADQCVGLVMRERSMFHQAEIIPWEQIVTIGPDAIIVQNAASKVNPSESPRVQAAMGQEYHLTGHRILTTDGKELGSFGDVFLDEDSGRVQGYELSGGFVSDTMSGKRYIDAASGPDIGRDVVMVPPQVQQQVENQEAGGLQGVAQAAGAKVADAYGAAKDKVTEVYGNVAEASIDKQKAFVIGKAASRDVFLPAPSTSGTTALTNTSLTESSALPTATPASSTATVPTTSSEGNYFIEENADGSMAVRPRRRDFTEAPLVGEAQGELLVRQGETITQAHADHAESAGILHSLVLAAGGTAASESYEAARERLAGATQGVQSQVAGAAGNVQQSAEESAIGQEAGKEVRLPSGSILVAPGMLITRAMMDTAKAQGKDKELIAAAGLGAASNAAQTAGANVQEKASGLFDSVKGKFAELTGTAGEKKDEFDAAREQKAINNALGRPVNRIILAQDDTVILNTGDIITHKAVDHARRENVLDVLLDSVSDVQPEITPEMLRVEGKGEAALSNQAEPHAIPIATPETSA